MPLLFLGDLFVHNLCKAIKQARQAHIDFEAFEEMELALEAWENDKPQPDPYKLPKASKPLSVISLIKILTLFIDISLSIAQLKLAEEEKAQIEAGNTPNYEVGAMGMVLLGIENEKFQYMYLSTLYSLC